MITNAKVQQLLNKYLPLLGEEYKDAVYTYRTANPTYTASTGAIEENQAPIPTKIIMLSFTFTEVRADFTEISGEAVQTKDKKGIVEISKLPAGIEIRKDDEFYIASDSAVFEVVGATKVPMGSIWLLHLRPKQENVGV